MDTPQPTDRTRLDSPGWSIDVTGNFKLDVSFDATSSRWLEVGPDRSVAHGWRLVLHEAEDDSSDASVEVIESGVTDVSALLHDVELDPFRFDHAPRMEV